MPGSPVRPPAPLWALVRGLASLGVLVVLALGVPATLVRHVGEPWPLRVPAWAELRRRVETGEVRGMVIVALAALVWLTWLRLMLAVLVEIVARGVHRARHREPSAVSALASGLVTGVSLLGLVFPSRPAVSVVRSEPPTRVEPSAAPESMAPTFVVRPEPAVLDGWRSAPFLAAGVVGAVEAARRHRVRSAPAGTVVRPLPEALARFEASARATAAPATLGRRGRWWACLVRRQAASTCGRAAETARSS